MSYPPYGGGPGYPPGGVIVVMHALHTSVKQKIVLAFTCMEHQLWLNEPLVFQL